MMLIAVLRDPDAAHQFHHEVRPSRSCRSCLEHLRDIGMVHHGQCLALCLETGDDRPGVHSKLDHLKRHAPPNRFLLRGHINNSATALTYFLKDSVLSDAFAESVVSEEFLRGPKFVRS